MKHKLLVDARTFMVREVFDSSAQIFFYDNMVVAPRVIFNDLNVNNSFVVDYAEDIPVNWKNYNYYYVTDKHKMVRIDGLYSPTNA